MKTTEPWQEFHHQTPPHNSPLSQKSLSLLSPQQAFNATAVVRHMRKLQLGTSQDGQGQTASHGELLTSAAGGPAAGCCCRDCCVEPGPELPPTMPPTLPPQL
ncbi:hypothetical protein CB1_000818001 [Camelus ferus]|nr:hypothetical protein CB1_000818001 [Camelus ferus]